MFLNIWSRIGLVALMCLFLLGCEEKIPEVDPAQLPQATLRVWTVGEPDFMEALGKEFVSVLQIQNLNVEVAAFPTQADLHEQLLYGLAEGWSPDVIATDGDWVFHNKAKLTPRLNDEGLGLARMQSTFVPATHQLLFEENRVWGLPLGVDTLATIYNEALFLERLDGEKVPGKLWRDLADQAVQLTQADNSFERFAVSGLALGRADNVRHAASILEHLLAQTIDQLFTPDGAESLLADSEGVTSGGEKVHFGEQTLSFFQSFASPTARNSMWNGFVTAAGEDDIDAFARGKVAVVFGNAQDVRELESTIEKLQEAGARPISPNVIRTAFFPQFSDDGERLFIGQVHTLAVPRLSRNPDIAWQFLKFSVNKANLQSFFQATGIPSSRYDLLLEQESVPGAEIFVRQAKVATATALPLGRPVFRAVLADLIHTLNQQKTTVSDGLRAGDQTLTETLQQMRTWRTLSPQ